MPWKHTTQLIKIVVFFCTTIHTYPVYIFRNFFIFCSFDSWLYTSSYMWKCDSCVIYKYKEVFLMKSRKNNIVGFCYSATGNRFSFFFLRYSMNKYTEITGRTHYMRQMNIDLRLSDIHILDLYQYINKRIWYTFFVSFQTWFKCDETEKILLIECLIVIH